MGYVKLSLPEKSEFAVSAVTDMGTVGSDFELTNVKSKTINKLIGIVKSNTSNVDIKNSMSFVEIKKNVKQNQILWIFQVLGNKYHNSLNE